MSCPAFFQSNKSLYGLRRALIAKQCQADPTRHKQRSERSSNSDQRHSEFESPPYSGPSWTAVSLWTYHDCGLPALRKPTGRRAAPTESRLRRLWTPPQPCSSSRCRYPAKRASAVSSTPLALSRITQSLRFVSLREGSNARSTWRSIANPRESDVGSQSAETIKLNFNRRGRRQHPNSRKHRRLAHTDVSSAHFRRKTGCGGA